MAAIGGPSDPFHAPMPRQYLDVPNRVKGAAKALGVRSDGAVQRMSTTAPIWRPQASGPACAVAPNIDKYQSYRTMP